MHTSSGRRWHPVPDWILLTVPFLLASSPSAFASVLVDLDSARLHWRNDGDSGIVLLREGRKRPWRKETIQATPLAAPDRLRFPPCRPGLPVKDGGCGAPLLPAGRKGLEMHTPLETTARALYERIWERLPLLPAEAELALAAAMEEMAMDLKGGLSFRRSQRAFLPVEKALRRAEEAAGRSPLLDRAQRAGDLFAIQQDLWSEKIAYASKDVNIPCDRLRHFERRFNQAAAAEVVRLRILHPRGICLFCGNVCTLESADLLLEQMKAEVVKALQPLP